MADYLIGLKRHIKRRNDDDNRLYLNKLLNGLKIRQKTDKKNNNKQNNISQK